jgi:hypothetical protein
MSTEAPAAPVTTDLRPPRPADTDPIVQAAHRLYDRMAAAGDRINGGPVFQDWHKRAEWLRQASIDAMRESVDAGELALPRPADTAHPLSQAAPEVYVGERVTSRDDAERVARVFHEVYEHLAPTYGYETRKASARPWHEVPADNRELMIATAAALLSRGVIELPAADPPAGPADEPEADTVPMGGAYRVPVYAHLGPEPILVGWIEIPLPRIEISAVPR